MRTHVRRNQLYLNEKGMVERSSDDTDVQTKEEEEEKEVRGKRNEDDDVKRGVGHECGVASAYGMRDCVHVLSATMLGYLRSSPHICPLSQISLRCVGNVVDSTTARASTDQPAIECIDNTQPHRPGGHLCVSV